MDIGDESSLVGKHGNFHLLGHTPPSYMCGYQILQWNYKSRPFAGQKKTDEAFSGQQPALLDTPSTYGNPTERDNSGGGGITKDIVFSVLCRSFGGFLRNAFKRRSLLSIRK